MIPEPARRDRPIWLIPPPRACRSAPCRAPTGAAKEWPTAPASGPVHQPGPRPWSSTSPTPSTPPETPEPVWPLRRPQHAPTGDGVKDLRPLPRAPCRALLDPAAYLDAPNNQRRPRTKDQLQEHGVDRPRSFRN